MFKSLIDLDPNDYKDVVFVGTVIANNDSGEEKYKYTERIKVKVPGLYDSDNESELPWCVPFKNRAFGSKPGQGVFAVPSIGSKVLVILQQGDQHNPAYIGSRLLEDATLDEFKTNYPQRYGFKDPAGNLFFVDTTSGSVDVHFQHKSGTTIHIDDAGNVTQTIVGNLTQQVNGSANIAVDGAASITASGGLNIQANTVFTGTITANGHRIDETHTHENVQNGDGISGAVT